MLQFGHPNHGKPVVHIVPGAHRTPQRADIGTITKCPQIAARDQLIREARSISSVPSYEMSSSARPSLP